MTTDEANKAIKNFQALKAQHDSFVAEIEPFKKSFYTFLSQNLHLSKWIDFNITSEAEDVELEHFELDLNNTVADGLLFVSVVDDFDGATTLSFIIPFAYMADPISWMNETLKKAADDQKLMEDIYDEIAPGIRDELNLDIYINSIYKSGEIYAVVCHKGNTGISLGHPDTQKMVINSFCVNSSTGELVTSTLI